jgi:hypothetical protein
MTGMTDTKPKPWLDAPECPHCGDTTATPLACREANWPEWSELAYPNHLYCPACGEDWAEDNWDVVAQAWWAAGAYRGRIAVERG